jgi:hypothetical protein
VPRLGCMSMRSSVPLFVLAIWGISQIGQRDLMEPCEYQSVPQFVP